ncbi:hypothetical protein ASPZODRAFT_132256 [Penicilliopsis zonata CBS 506.65]|uniref:Uncharacterized protein n=1 Tax=Penicilliopsis zonata CBS 506.65 TaxID=1073090 RepID=A0A1L9SJ62_9EURO|nr:hypothetical protein ASPZODRAFT_132256 [Penicilliopsis zonata CBS 506.65]OJJ47272.1 hypothetical protein ASPZODRAFT_132256 [Penicilliopsis zonata CBS 506.65]
MQLFAGTFIIFFVGIVFWKTGAFFRRFTQRRIFRTGRTTETRCVGKWYGWVSLSRHEATKDVVRKFFGKLHDWTAWRSSRADYHWVWWDPGQKGLQQYYNNRRIIKWLPSWLQSYEYTPADAMWNPGPPRARTLSWSETRGLVTPALALPPIRDSTLSLGARRGFEEVIDDEAAVPRKIDPRLLRPNRFERNHLPSLFSDTKMGATQTPSLALPAALREYPHLQKLETDYSPWGGTNSTGRPKFSCTLKDTRWERRYQVWAARMQVQTCKVLQQDSIPMMDPPGSPILEILASGSLQDYNSPRSTISHVPNSHAGFTDENARTIVRQPRYMRKPLSQVQKPRSEGWLEYSCAPVSSAAKIYLTSMTTPCLHGRSFRKPLYFDGTMPHRGNKTENQTQVSPVQRQSDWEIRLVNTLDRKLEWLGNEMDPGRRPYQFAIFPNHWLNPAAWHVFDPVSRVSQDNRRLWGDPRFNVPYPEPSYQPISKYRRPRHRRARTPKIDSWRAAVNQYRIASGTGNVLALVDLFESSADEPPDGHIDTASWMLPKPPQGFGLSTKQKKAYFEGGAGWQESLEEWQHVDGAYRIRKGLYEGRVNRTRLREVLTNVGGQCRVASSKISAHLGHLLNQEDSS